MKRSELLRLLRTHGCVLKREGSRHSLYVNPANGIVETIPRHAEIDERLAVKILRRLDIPKQ